MNSRESAYRADAVTAYEADALTAYKTDAVVRLSHSGSYSLTIFEFPATAFFASLFFSRFLYGTRISLLFLIAVDRLELSGSIS